ncbi:MAG: hypothetical protein NTW04_02240, partial [Elusimicrobia bacterium]|nr:hypothetical protein [Elusimicrobiota bacterium]
MKVKNYSCLFYYGNQPKLDVITIICARGEWSCKLLEDIPDMINKTCRNFLEYEKGKDKTFEAIKEIQTEEREAKQFHWTKCGVIAAISAAVLALLTLIQSCHK